MHIYTCFPRRSRAPLVLGLVLLLHLLAPRGVAAQDAGGIAPGARAPVVSAQDLTGRTVPVGPVAGVPVLIEFWATWCPYCERLEPRMKAVHAKYGRQVRFYAVAVNVNESVARVARHVASRGLRYPVLYDASGAATREYDVPATSFVVIIDADGRVAYTGMGDGQDLAAALAHVLASTRPGGRI
jgi:thiol-disulfide isomerase/thioredoxin